ncbi:hypothetical protein MRX96_005331 [Rhipicephalus microplus]|uniref:Uncharacterized protein n=1 Tax=Rhipicephalus microplus TaxID=6941 RepID=A0A9J6DB16_RHIMP|nr:hypothetical protein HPB51_017414 [Rhipicephalus microplus]
MMACVSPCDLDFVERLNSLRHVNWFKNIKNLIAVNEDKSSDTITALRMEIQEHKRELKECKQGRCSAGERWHRASERQVLPEHPAPARKQLVHPYEGRPKKLDAVLEGMVDPQERYLLTSCWA